MSEECRVCSSSQPEVFQLTDCVTGVTQDTGSAIDEFETALTALAKSSGIIDAAAHSDVLSEMFIISAVSSVESYFRRLLSSLAAICPLTASNISKESLHYGAAAVYPRELLALALLERSLFSSKGVVVKEIGRFTKFDAAKHSELSSAIDAFETVCLIRHAAAHWRGYLDSEGASRIGILSSGSETYRIQLSSTLVQRAFAVCDHLVHLANHTLFRFTIRKWIEVGHLRLDGNAVDVDLVKAKQLIDVFGSREYCSTEQVDAETLVGRLTNEVT